MDQITGTEDIKTTVSESNNNVNSLQACKVSKEDNQACKVQNLGTRIPSDTSKRFHDFVYAKHGKINGVFSQEVTKALESWMSNQQQTTSYAFLLSSKAGRPRTDAIEKYRRIAMRLKQLSNFPFVNHYSLLDAIKFVLGDCDPRTLKKYLGSIRKLCKEEFTRFGTAPLLDVSKFVEKIQSDDW